MTLGSRIKEQRKKLGLTQPALAEKIDMSLNSIKQLETDRVKPSLETLEKLTDLFEVSSDYLLCRTDDPTMVTWEHVHFIMGELLSVFKEDHESTNKLRKFIDRRLQPSSTKKLTVAEDQLITKLVDGIGQLITESIKSKDNTNS